MIWLFLYSYSHLSLLHCIENDSSIIDLIRFFPAESDGSIEREFPALDAKEPLSKFGFTVLGLVEIEGDSQSSEANSKGNEVLVILPDGSPLHIDLETKAITLKELIEKAFSQSEKSFVRNPRIEMKYNIEMKDKPGEPLEQESLLSG